MTTASEIMTRDVAVLRPNASIREIARVLASRRISAAPVVDSQGGLVGIVSEGDLIGHRGAVDEERRAWWLEMLADGFDLSPEFLRYARTDKRTAADVMSKEIVFTDEKCPVEEVARLLEERRIKRVPVLRDGVLVGIVSRADVVRAMAQRAT
jgi:CBS domain-containing protein